MHCTYYPLVSVVILTFNRRKMLKRAIDSVLSQDYRNIELIVSDNASTDETHLMMADYCEKYPNIKYNCHSDNIGRIKNGYSAYLNVSGKYYIILCDDDYLGDCTFLSEAVTAMEENAQIALVRGIVLYVDEDDNVFSLPFYRIRRLIKGIEFYINYQRPGYEHIESFFALMRKEFVDKSGIMNINPPGLDHWLWRMLCLYGDVYFIPKIIGYYRNNSVNKDSKSLEFAMDFHHVYDTVKWISDQAIVLYPEYKDKILEQRAPDVEAAQVIAFYINVLKQYKSPKEIKNIIKNSYIIKYPKLYNELMKVSGLKNIMLKELIKKIFNKLGFKIIRI